MLGPIPFSLPTHICSVPSCGFFLSHQNLNVLTTPKLPGWFQPGSEHTACAKSVSLHAVGKFQKGLCHNWSKLRQGGVQISEDQI